MADKDKLSPEPDARKTSAGSARESQDSGKSRPTSQGSKKEGKGKGGKGKGKGVPKKEVVEDVKSDAGEAKDVLPEGCFPIFLATKTQEIFDIRLGENVSEENPEKYITKEDIQQDMFTRAAVSDFSPFKDKIKGYPEDDILVIYDADFKYGQNFYIALTLEGRDALLKPPSVEGAEGSQAPEEEIDESIYQYIPPVSKPWVSQGSEEEVNDQMKIDHRPLLKFTIKRKRREFGAPVEFTDRGVGAAKDAYQECTPYEDANFDLRKIEMNRGTQSVPNWCTIATQTTWKYPRNACTQYYYREMTEEDQEKVFMSEEMKKFLKDVEPRFLLTLQQNHIMNVFTRDFANLGDSESSFGTKADNHLKEFQSFTDLQYSKQKTVTYVDWHPTIKGVVAVSVAEKMTYTERVDNAERIIMHPSLILIWSFADPIHPQLLLEAPDDVLCFKFSPTDPNIVAGGCINGQVILWDLSNHSEKLKASRSARKKNTNALPGFEDEYAMDSIIVRYCAVSSIEHSHKAPINDIQWVPDHFEVTKMGAPIASHAGDCCQIITAATDSTVLFWDTRPAAKGLGGAAAHKQKQESGPMGIPTTFKHLDLTWRPMLRVNLFKSEPGGDHAPTCFSISEKQGGGDTGAEESSSSTVPKEKSKALNAVKTFFYVGTEDGELVYLDWMPQKDADTGKVQTPKPAYYHAVHAGPIVTLQRSPFFRDVVLVVGGWTFTLWKETVSSGPLLHSSSANRRYTAGHWSPSRPSVFFLARLDGSVEIWDLLDRTHEPAMSQNITPSMITYISPFMASKKQHLLALGDNLGTLHILEIPRSLQHASPNEVTATQAYFDREEKRRAFVVNRWNFREQEKIEMEMEAKKRAGIAPNVMLTDEEVEMRQRIEYEQYLKEETAFLRELGLLKEEVKLD